MKKLMMMTAIGLAFAAQTIPAFADATSAQKEQIQEARLAVRQALTTDEGCKAMCEEMMNNDKSKKMMIEMMKKDPDAMAAIKG